MKITVIASDCLQTRILYNYLKDDFEIQKVIIEDKIKKSRFIKNKIKKVGLPRTVDQLLFIAILNRILLFFSKRRISEIYTGFNLKADQIPEKETIKVNSVNSNETVNLIKLYQPDVIIISGTRIISKNLIDQVNVPMINIHTGITPDYRGVHGAYWALVNDEPEIAGVTVHYVDKGVDTGKVIAQKKISIHPNDNIVTYPFLQLSVGLELLKVAMKSQLSVDSAGNFLTKGKSRQWYHPGLFEYLYYLLFKGVK